MSKRKEKYKQSEYRRSLSDWLDNNNNTKKKQKIKRHICQA